MRIFLTLLAFCLFLVGILAGGCSLVFTPFFFSGDPWLADGSIWLIWLGGFLLAGVCIFAAFAIERNR